MIHCAGMIRLSVKEVAEARGFPNAKQLADAAGILPTSMYSIWQGRATRIDLATLDKLCALLRVHPGLLFEYMLDKAPDPIPQSQSAKKVEKKKGRKR